MIWTVDTTLEINKINDIEQIEIEQVETKQVEIELDRYLKVCMVFSLQSKLDVIGELSNNSVGECLLPHVCSYQF